MLEKNNKYIKNGAAGFSKEQQIHKKWSGGVLCKSSGVHV